MLGRLGDWAPLGHRLSVGFRPEPGSDLGMLERGKRLGFCGWLFWASIEAKYFASTGNDDEDRLRAMVERGVGAVSSAIQPGCDDSESSGSEAEAPALPELPLTPGAVPGFSQESGSPALHGPQARAADAVPESPVPKSASMDTEDDDGDSLLLFLGSSGRAKRSRAAAAAASTDLDRHLSALEEQGRDSAERSAQRLRRVLRASRAERLVASSGLKQAWQESATLTERAYLALVAPHVREARQARKRRRQGSPGLAVAWSPGLASSPGPDGAQPWPSPAAQSTLQQGPQEAPDDGWSGPQSWSAGAEAEAGTIAAHDGALVAVATHDAPQFRANLGDGMRRSESLPLPPPPPPPPSSSSRRPCVPSRQQRPGAAVR